jgi:hypothetical protein
MLRSLALAVALLLAGVSVASAQQAAFAPGGATVSLAATTTTSRVAIQVGNHNKHVRIFNSGAATVFIQCGNADVEATTADSMPIAQGTVEVIGCAQSNVAGITSAGTATLYFTPGSGL